MRLTSRPGGNRPLLWCNFQPKNGTGCEASRALHPHFRGCVARSAPGRRKTEREVVRSRRLELPRELPHSDLNAARLPIPPRPLKTPRPAAPDMAIGHPIGKHCAGPAALPNLSQGCKVCPRIPAHAQDPIETASGRRVHPRGVGHKPCPRILRGGSCRHGGPRGGDCGRRGRGLCLAPGAPAPLHRRHQRRRGRAARSRAVPRVQDRPRRPLHLPRPRPARGLCDARPLAPRP